MIDKIFKDGKKIDLLKLMRFNLKKIAGTLVFLILIVIFFFYKDYQEKKQNIIISNKYNESVILINKNQSNQAKELLHYIINKKNKFYSPLALFLLIENKIINEDIKIIDFFDTVISIKNLDQENKNLIIIKKTLYLLANNNNSKIEELLNPIINSNSEWRKQAITILANFYLSKGEGLKSKEYFDLLKTKF
ncbi:hypothetical protein OAS47_04255 [Pelagibacteraceae bacterium]|nr:hypothetical protein [Pelagibacteraceae bacterium]